MWIQVRRVSHVNGSMLKRTMLEDVIPNRVILEAAAGNAIPAGRDDEVDGCCRNEKMVACPGRRTLQPSFMAPRSIHRFVSSLVLADLSGGTGFVGVCSIPTGGKGALSGGTGFVGVCSVQQNQQLLFLWHPLT